LEVFRADGEGHLAVVALDLMRSSGAQRGVEGDVVGLSVYRARLYVAPALAVGAGAGAASGLAAGQPVERRIQAARYVKFGPRLNALAAFPPACARILEDVLRARLRLADLRRVVKVWRVLL
jgi:hypothetical protein